MKRIFLLVTLGFTLLFASAGFAAYNPYIKLQYHFTGVQDKKIQKNVQNTLDNLYSKQHFPLKPHEAMRFIDKTPTAIYNALTPYGYFHAKTQTAIQKNGALWVVQFNIQLGPPLPITAVDIQIHGPGKYDKDFEKWLNKSPLKVGSPLHTEQYEDAKTNLYNIAVRRGYFSAKLVKNEIQINKRAYHAKIILIFDTGSRARFGDTTFSKTPFYTSFLTGFLQYKKGAYYNADRLDQTQNALTGSTFFNQVMIKPDIHKIKNGEVPIHIKLIPRHKKQYIFGLGYGTDTGVRVTAGVTLRHLNGRGHRFQTMIRASQSDSSAIARYLIPGSDPANDLYTYAIGATTIDQASGSARSFKTSAEYATQKGHWKYSIELAYLHEKYNLNNLPQTTAQLVFPTFNAKYINADNPRLPHKGISIAFQLTGANKNLLSETTFYQITAHLKTLYTIEMTHTRLLFRSSLGHTMINNIDNLPLSLQLLAGGSQSVRGYSYNSLGPGRNLAILSGEVQQKTYKDFYAAWFLDAGKVCNSNPFKQMNVGTGPGIAWISDIGTLELTFAKAITVSGDPWSIQFVMGTNL